MIKLPGWMGRLVQANSAQPAVTDGFWYYPVEQGPGGVLVTPETAMRHATVYSCVRVVTEDIAKLPLILYRRLRKGGKERAKDHPLYRVLHSRPNGWQTSFEFRQLFQRNLELRGNAYAEKIIGSDGRIEQLIPIHPDRVEETEQLPNGKIRYQIRKDGGERRPYLQEQIFHLRGFSTDGITGMSTIREQRESIGVGLSAQQFRLNMYRNGGRPSGALIHPAPQAPKQEGREDFRNRIRQEYGGPENAGKIMVLWENMKWEPMGMTMEDAQFIEAIKADWFQICGMFRVPPHKTGNLERATFSNIEEQAIEYVVDGLMGRIARWEQAISRDLLTEAGQDEYFVEFLIDGLLRGNVQNRYTAYSIARRGKWMNANEIRELENMNPIEGGDVYENPDITPDHKTREDEIQ